MADFCLRCNIDMGFGPYSDFAHLEKDCPGYQKFRVLCEGCGVIAVDPQGRCLGEPGCLSNHPLPGDDEVLRGVERWRQRRRGLPGRAYRLWDWWDGTAWQPGMKHELRWRWNDWRSRTGRNDDDFQF